MIDASFPIITALCVLALFLVSFFFSGTETALFLLRHDRRRELLDQRVETLQERRSDLLATLLLGNVGANIALAAYGAVLVNRFAPDRLWLNVALLTPLIVLLVEVTPKRLAAAYPRQWTSVAWWPLNLFWFVVSPLRIVFAGLVNIIVRAFGADPERYSSALGTAELLELVGSGAASGALDELERDIIEAVFEFDDITVERLMTPRTEMFSLPLTLSWEELLKRAAESGHTRIPIQGGRSDDIIGVLLLKDLLKHRKHPPAGPRQLRALLLPTVFVPSTKSADAMLAEFLEQGFAMAFVVDEHGTLVGLVTLDDLLSELMGELDNEDPDKEDTGPLGGPWLLDGALDAEDFRDQTGIDLPDGEYNTLGGFVFMQLGRLPAPGDVVSWANHQFVVREMDGRRISMVHVAPEAVS